MQRPCPQQNLPQMRAAARLGQRRPAVKIDDRTHVRYGSVTLVTQRGKRSGFIAPSAKSKRRQANPVVLKELGDGGIHQASEGAGDARAFHCHLIAR